MTLAKINTVTGPIASDELGYTLIHEHLLIGFSGWELDTRAGFDRAGAMSRCVDRLQELRSYGVKTVVDPCPMDLGRDPLFQQEASSKSSVQIVAATGFYHVDRGYLPYFHDRTEDEIVDIFIDELTVGMGGTDVRAGIIKCANAGRITEQDEKVLRAAARAAQFTGSPIITHNMPTRPVGLEQLDIFESTGTAASQIIIGHACGAGDMRYYLDVLGRGAYLAFDQFGMEMVASDEMRLACLLGLVHSGYADRLMLSHDSVACFVGRGWEFPSDVRDKMVNWRPTHIIQQIVPNLLQRGVTQTAIDTMMIENPMRVFRSGPVSISTTKS